MGWGNVRATMEHGVPGALLRGDGPQVKPPVYRAPPIPQAPPARSQEPHAGNGNGSALDALSLLRLEGARMLLGELGVEITPAAGMAEMVAAAGSMKASAPPAGLGMQIVAAAVQQIDELREELASYLQAPAQAEDIEEA
jgi:hypothetical protein